MQKFEKLKVWHESLNLIKMVYELCQSLPHNEEKNLIDQIKRSSASISLNIAEGCGADSDKEFRRFLLIGKKSTFEVIGILRIIQFLYKMQIKEIEDKAILIIKLYKWTY